MEKSQSWSGGQIIECEDFTKTISPFVVNPGFEKTTWQHSLLDCWQATRPVDDLISAAGKQGRRDYLRRLRTDGSETLEFPQYTKPAEFRGMKVPDVLISGNHALIAKWRKTIPLKAE